MNVSPRIQAEKDIDTVRDLFRGLRPELYGRDEEGRQELYCELLRQLCEVIGVDGGPTLVRTLLDVMHSILGEQEKRRGSREIGPFLSRAQCQALIEDPYLELRPRWQQWWPCKKSAGEKAEGASAN